MRNFLAVMLVAGALGLAACDAVDKKADFNYENSAPYSDSRTAGEQVFDHAQHK